jgi:hypothetical protein
VCGTPIDLAERSECEEAMNTWNVSTEWVQDLTMLSARPPSSSPRRNLFCQLYNTPLFFFFFSNRHVFLYRPKVARVGVTFKFRNESPAKFNFNTSHSFLSYGTAPRKAQLNFSDKFYEFCYCLEYQHEFSTEINSTVLNTNRSDIRLRCIRTYNI